MRRTSRDPERRLRAAVERLPQHTKEAMLRGIASNRIIVGAYVDSTSGGICPMLAAHRNGGRTDVAAFARAWDEYTARAARAAPPAARSRSCARCSSGASTSTRRSTTSRSPRSPPRSAPSGASGPATSSPSRRSPLPEPADAPIRVRRRAPKTDVLAATERELSAPAPDPTA